MSDAMKADRVSDEQIERECEAMRDVMSKTRSFTAMHQAAKSSLGIIEQLRRDLDAARCGTKGDGTGGSTEFSTTSLVEALRQLATLTSLPTYRRAEVLAAADRLAAMFNAFVAPCPHEIERDNLAIALSAARDVAHAAHIERDEARELHADVSMRYGALSAQLGEAQREIESLRAQLVIERSRREEAA